jgi:hypothetical protein
VTEQHDTPRDIVADGGEDEEFIGEVDDDELGDDGFDDDDEFDEELDNDEFDDPDIGARLEASLARLEAVFGRPPVEQVPVFAEVHRTLQTTLALIDAG